MPLYSDQTFFKNEQKSKPLNFNQATFNAIYSGDTTKELSITDNVISWFIDLPRSIDKSMNILKNIIRFKDYIDEKTQHSAQDLLIIGDDYKLMLICYGYTDCNHSMVIDGDIDSYASLLEPLLQGAIDEKKSLRLMIQFNQKIYAKWIQPHLETTLADGEDLIELLDVLYSGGYQTQKLT
ncbi:hypothetical protein [Legionella bononiensis]|uniref:Uncharacterized protein n=1 Tax=Legionella bononiensis TaxID=2793102 RepID=A0ABS1W9J2_9GAMM|nr:hypothetical protein [Legionella bononiensis]MBL7480777.1 hypothetical protein [Legionella bononiensis]MBL7526024.1 hypothetical protein [Legionella bononiensis]MBL7563481.1 hypothetical protein [Legionella bononiensis]